MTERSDEQRETSADVSDRATAVEMLTNEQALLEMRRSAVPQQQPVRGVFEIEDCILCGNEIGEERLRVAIKNLLCIHCANREERRR